MENLTNDEKYLLSHIPTSDYITQDELNDLLGFKPRTIRLYINSMRLKGVPIASDTNKGYRLATNPLDLKVTLQQLITQYKTLGLTISALRSIDFDIFNKEYKDNEY